MTYANETALTPSAVIEGAVKHFLDLDTSLTRGPGSTAEKMSLLSELPPALQNQAKQYAEKAEMPAEFVIELAISHFLDPDSVTFDDCQVKVEQSSMAWLKQYANDIPMTAA